MSIDFLLCADTREDFEAMAKSQGFMTEDGYPTDEVIYDPTPYTAEYETGIPIAPGMNPLPAGPSLQYDPIIGFHFNLRVVGARAERQVEGIPQYDAEGNLLPLRQRTTFGLWMSELGKEKLHPNQHTTYTLASHVYFIDPENVWTRQRVWL